MPRSQRDTGFTFTAEIGAGFTDLAVALEKAASPAGIRRRLQDVLLQEAERLEPEVRNGILASAPTGKKSTGLRRRIARTVESGPTRRGTAHDEVGASVYLLADRMPDGEKSLPAYWEGAKGRWRHPVYGHDTRWVAQAQHPSFFKTLNRRGSRFEDALARELERLARAL